ncbi:MAG: DUF167 domain-containing protein [Candidatus Micrarchaeia archaeon]
MAYLEVHVHPGSQSSRICFGSNDVLEVYLTEKAEGNRANMQLLKMLKKEFGCESSIVRGLRARRKVIWLDIEGDELSEIISSEKRKACKSA